MQDIRSRKEKNAPTSLAISMAMQIRRYGAERIAKYGRSRATLDATEHRDRASIHPNHPSGCHGHRFWHKKSSCGIVKSLFEASVKKARNGPLYSAHRSDELSRKVERHD